MLDESFLGVVFQSFKVSPQNVKTNDLPNVNSCFFSSKSPLLKYNNYINIKTS